MLMGIILQQLGIQGTQSNVDQVLIALYTGLLIAVTAGLVVGIAVWLVQSRYERRRLRQQHTRDVAIIKEKIRSALDNPHETDIASIRTLPQPARTIAEVISESSLDQLKEKSRKKQKLFDLLKAFQQANSKFALTAIQLQQPVRAYIRQFCQQSNLPISEDVKYESFYLGRILQFQNKAIMVWTGITPDSLPGLEKLLELIFADKGVVQLGLAYVQARGDLETALDKIRAEFGYKTLQVPDSLFRSMPEATYLTNSALT
jgi:uncharacterized membrane-anchored protein YhcB (DUF1043 family)